MSSDSACSAKSANRTLIMIDRRTYSRLSKHRPTHSFVGRVEEVCERSSGALVLDGVGSLLLGREFTQNSSGDVLNLNVL